MTVSTGIITTIAGTGSGSFSGDGSAATSAALYRPYAVTFDSSGIAYFRIIHDGYYLHGLLLGDLYISDSGNGRVRKVTMTTGIINTIAGSSVTSFYGDGGAATSAGLSATGIAVDTAGTSLLLLLYIRCEASVQLTTISFNRQCIHI